MVEFPIDKYLAQDYRATLKTFDAPQNIETKNPIIPVVDIQKGFPKPNARQILHYTFISIGTSATSFQVATVMPNKKIYFLGMSINVTAAVATNISGFDAISGTGPSTSANTAYLDELGFFAYLFTGATLGELRETKPQLPIEVKFGIRCVAGGAGQSGLAIVTWIEEQV